MSTVDVFLAQLATHAGVIVCVESTEGSVPRGAGTWMAVFPESLVGTIGGGRLEYEAIAYARQMLSGGATGDASVRRVPLGPSLGQCCGGVVHLRFESVSAVDRETLRVRLRAALAPVALFGGGHVGAALAQVLSRLPFALLWIDSRDGIFPADVSPAVACEHSDPVHGAVASLPVGCSVLIMSFSHAEDLDIVAACLARQRRLGDLRYIGLIGSKTKWATFRHRLAQRGFSAEELAWVTCPIGVPGISGKEPEIIAVAVAAQLLQHSAKG